MAANDDLYLGVGNVSLNSGLGAYYQDLTPAIFHFKNDSIGSFDDNDIPFIYRAGEIYYSIVYVIQYALILHDLMLEDGENRKETILHCLDWLEQKSEKFNDALVWRNDYNKQYDLKDGWISAMYQGQAISLFLRAYQLFHEEKYLVIARKAFESLKYDFKDGGVMRRDSDGYLWFEEYPTNKPSFVLNGFVYTMFGVLDYYRAVDDPKAKAIFDDCVRTLEANLSKYDVWYWSIYDQLKKQLVSYYYQKNVHVPLMEIMYLITKKSIFNHYASKWQRNLNNPVHLMIVKLMYRIRPKIQRWLPG